MHQPALPVNALKNCLLRLFFWYWM